MSGREKNDVTKVFFSFYCTFTFYPPHSYNFWDNDFCMRKFFLYFKTSFCSLSLSLSSKFNVIMFDTYSLVCINNAQDFFGEKIIFEKYVISKYFCNPHIFLGIVLIFANKSTCCPKFWKGPYCLPVCHIIYANTVKYANLKFELKMYLTKKKEINFILGFKCEVMKLWFNDFHEPSFTF